MSNDFPFVPLHKSKNLSEPKTKVTTFNNNNGNIQESSWSDSSPKSDENCNTTIPHTDNVIVESDNESLFAPIKRNKNSNSNSIKVKKATWNNFLELTDK